MQQLIHLKGQIELQDYYGCRKDGMRSKYNMYQMQKYINLLMDKVISLVIF